MKRILLLSALIFGLENAAYTQPCTLSTDTAHLDVNNARVILQASGDFFWDRQNAGFFVPKGDVNQPQASTIFAGGLWLGGCDSGCNLKLATSRHGASAGKTDWFPGPLIDTATTTNASLCANFDKLWKIKRSDVMAHIADFAADGHIDGPVPQAILEWPGRDNPNSLTANGFALPAGQDLAPFVDRNGNGKYEPKSGDYPFFKGDQAVWWVFNDDGGGAFHGETNSTSIRTEIHAIAFGFEGQGNDDLANTTFYDFTIINKAKEFIQNTYVGLWLDAKLGCPVDDNIGCISGEKLALIYNSDTPDGQSDCDCMGTPTYCDDIPVVGIKVLSSPFDNNGNETGFSSFVYETGSGLINPPSWLSYPPYDVEYYRLLSGNWVDGSPVTYGGNGYNAGATQSYPFVYDGNPSESGSWSLCNVSQPGYDYRMLINSGPFFLDPGAKTSVCYAVMNKFGLPQPCPDITPLIEMGDAVQQYCASLTSTEDHNPDVAVAHFFPNPLHENGTLTTDKEALISAQIFSPDGRIVQEYHQINTTELMIERGNLPGGLYFYSALLHNGQIAIGKIIVQ